MYKKIKKILDDTVYVSQVTKTKNIKSIIFLAVVLSQLSVFADILIILFFAYLITGELSTNENLLPILETLFSFEVLLPAVVILRFSFNYLQNMILKKLELNIQKSLKTHLLKEIFEKRNYSIADAYFYINTLTIHVSFFYSSFALFLNHFLQVGAFSIYLFYSDPLTMGTFSLFGLILFYPILSLIKKARQFMHESFLFGQDSNQEIQRVVDNMFLIKLLNKEKEEVNRFSTTLENLNSSLLNNHKYGILNSFFPSFITIFILSILTMVSNISKNLTLDFIGVTLRLFQSVGNMTTSINQIINSHVHMEKFYEIENSKEKINKANFVTKIEEASSEIVKAENLSFKYVNSDEFIFENINLSIRRNKHTVITGPNGSGKSTLLGLLAGVFYPVKGSVTTNTNKFGYVGASPMIFTGTLKENLLYGNENLINDDRILDFLKKFQLFKENSNYDLNKLVDNKSLSSGQIQKVAFIRALLNNPDVLILDESTANLDEQSKKIILELIDSNKITIINSTHDLDMFGTVDYHYNIEIVKDKRIIKEINKK